MFNCVRLNHLVSVQMTVIDVLITHCRQLDNCISVVCVCLSGSRGTRRLQKISSTLSTFRDTMQRSLPSTWTGEKEPPPLTLLTTSLFSCSTVISVTHCIIQVVAKWIYMAVVLLGNFRFCCTSVALLPLVMVLLHTKVL